MEVICSVGYEYFVDVVLRTIEGDTYIDLKEFDSSSFLEVIFASPTSIYFIKNGIEDIDED